jgi:hypothetical protein
MDKPISAAVLSIDIVSYSKEFDELQVRLIGTLSSIVRLAIAKISPSKKVLLPTGDGMIIVLLGQSSSSALEIALHIHKTIKSKLIRLNLRMGIHEGQALFLPDVNGRKNIAGNVMNICQRVMDVGDTNHILISESAYLSLKNSKQQATRLFALQANPIEVKHGLRLNLYNYYDGECGNPRTPTKVTSNVGVVYASIGRPSIWQPFVETTNKLKIIGHCLRLLASPDFQDVLEVSIRTKGTRVQILLLNSLSTASDLRKHSKAYKSTTELESTFDYIFKSLRDFQLKIRDAGEQANKSFDVRLFDAVPTFAGFITDEKAHISFYLESALGSMGPFFSCNRLPSGPSLYESVDTAFDAIWQYRSFSIFDRTFPTHQQDLIKERRKLEQELKIPQYQQVKTKSK